MLPTPSTSHVPYDRVYEPAEDSFLLLDTLSSNGETSFLKAHFATGTAPLVCEVGVGSGVVLAFVASNAEALIGRRDVLALGTDLNEFACSSAAQTVLEAIQERETEHHRQAVSLGCINGDLTAAIRSKQVDILIFNPPYVPAPLPRATWEPAAGAVSSQEAFERDSYLLELSYAGGQDGMEVTNRLLEGLPEVLSARGVAYVLLCAQNKPRDVQHRIERRGEGWRAKLVGSSGKQAGWEKLAILRIWRDQMS